MNEIKKYGSENVNRLLVGNKADIEDKRQVSFEEGKELADSLGITFLETSAKTSQNVETSFVKMAKEIKDRVGGAKNAGVSQPRGQKLGSGVSIDNKNKKQGCC